MYLTQKELKEIHDYLEGYRNTPEAQSMKQYCQHGAVSTYDHVMHVTYLSYYLNRRLGRGQTANPWSSALFSMIFIYTTGTKKTGRTNGMVFIIHKKHYAMPTVFFL